MSWRLIARACYIRDPCHRVQIHSALTVFVWLMARQSLYIICWIQSFMALANKPSRFLYIRLFRLFYGFSSRHFQLVWRRSARKHGFAANQVPLNMGFAANQVPLNMGFAANLSEISSMDNNWVRVLLLSGIVHFLMPWKWVQEVLLLIVFFFNINTQKIIN